MTQSEAKHRSTAVVTISRHGVEQSHALHDVLNATWCPRCDPIDYATYSAKHRA